MIGDATKNISEPGLGIIAKTTTRVLSTGSDLFKFLKGMTPDGGTASAQHGGDKR